MDMTRFDRTGAVTLDRGALAAPRRSSRRPGRIVLSDIVCAIAALLLVDQVLLWRFLGLVGTPLAAVLAVAAIGVALGVARRRRAGQAIRLSTLLPAAIIALILCALGGEGRLFYAGTDWQVRGAVLRDLTLYPWPFLYAVDATPDLLRAPLGMYLLPAVVGKLGGVRVAEFALLAQNTAVLTGIFALGAPLFAGRRARLIALAIFIGFSGMDALGQAAAGQSLAVFQERWDVAIFSSAVTQIFAVPQHCFAGWIAAALYLLWRTGQLDRASVLATIPLLALWSPLALMGAMPFAAHVALDGLIRRTLRRRDIVLPALSALLAAPALLYMTAGSGAVGGDVAGVPLHQYIAFEAFEVAPYLLALFLIARARRFGGITLALVATSLLAAPYIQVGQSSDFVMRGSIPALAILAVAVADALTRAADRASALWRGVLAFAFGVGLLTPTLEIWRAVAWPRSPRILCSYYGVVPGGYSTYVAPITRIPVLIAPRRPVIVTPHDPPSCWNGAWPRASLG